MALDDPGFYDRFIADLMALEEKRVVASIDLAPHEAIAVVGMLHLALRHPQNRGPSALAVNGVISRIIECVGVTETLRQGMKAGADPRYDTPTPPMRGDAVVRPTVVCLCGSTRFMTAFYDANMRETLCGRIVLSVGMSSHGDYKPTEEQKLVLDELHLRKIDMADEILVLDCPAWKCSVCGNWRHKACCPKCEHGKGDALKQEPYIGESTAREIAYAKKHGKRIRYLSQETT